MWRPAAYCRPITVDRDHTRVWTRFLSITRQPAAYCRPITVGRDHTRVWTRFPSITRRPAAYCMTTYAWLGLPALLEAINGRGLVIGFEWGDCTCGVLSLTSPTYPYLPCSVHPTEMLRWTCKEDRKKNEIENWERCNMLHLQFSGGGAFSASSDHLQATPNFAAWHYLSPSLRGLWNLPRGRLLWMKIFVVLISPSNRTSAGAQKLATTASGIGQSKQRLSRGWTARWSGFDSLQGLKTFLSAETRLALVPT
jgi:hypothetical protein